MKFHTNYYKYIVCSAIAAIVAMSGVIRMAEAAETDGPIVTGIFDPEPLFGEADGAKPLTDRQPLPSQGVINANGGNVRIYFGGKLRTIVQLLGRSILAYSTTPDGKELVFELRGDVDGAKIVSDPRKGYGVRVALGKAQVKFNSAELVVRPAKQPAGGSEIRVLRGEANIALPNGQADAAKKGAGWKLTDDDYEKIVPDLTMPLPQLRKKGVPDTAGDIRLAFVIYGAAPSDGLVGSAQERTSSSPRVTRGGGRPGQDRGEASDDEVTDAVTSASAAIGQAGSAPIAPQMAPLPAGGGPALSANAADKGSVGRAGVSKPTGSAAADGRLFLAGGPYSFNKGIPPIRSAPGPGESGKDLLKFLLRMGRQSAKTRVGGNFGSRFGRRFTSVRTSRTNRHSRFSIGGK